MSRSTSVDDIEKEGQTTKGESVEYLKLPIRDPTTDIPANEFHRLPMKCHSCGAFIQTEKEDYPGFIYPKKLVSLLKSPFEQFICSNCFSLHYKSQKLVKSINKDGIMRQLQHLPYTRALVLYVVDVTDISGTVFPNLLEVIGLKKRIVIVGNKVDMLAADDKPRKQEAHITSVLKKHCISEGLQNANIKDICLVSGRTGYGIEKLVVLINKYRDLNMDLYIVGSSNVGKSAIFNMLQNLSCISKDGAIPTQAITHYLPGCSFGLVRHPIAFWRMRKVRNMLLEKPPEETFEPAETLEFIEDIQHEIISKKQKNQELPKDSSKEIIQSKIGDLQYEFVDLTEKEKEKCWMYDTPGLPNEQQITQFLTAKELKFIQQYRWIVPKTFILQPGDSLLIGGLARIDYSQIWRTSRDNPEEFDEIPKASQSIYCTLFVSHNIPIHPTSIEKATSVLEKHFGDHILKIPFGDEERQALFPALQPHSYEIKGTGWDTSCADLSVAGIGWMALTAGKGSQIKVQLHTPNGIGQHLRTNCLMPHSVTKRGKRGVRHLGNLNRRIYECTRKQNPQLISAFDKQNEIINAWIDKINKKQNMQRFQIKQERKKLLLEQGMVGKMRQLATEVDLIEEIVAKAKATALESGEMKP
eukprot:gene5455-6137_t